MGVPSQGCEWGGGSHRICAPPEAVGLGAGTCGPRRGVEVGDAGAERCARRGHVPVPVLSPPHPSRPGAGLPVAMAAPPPMGSVAMAMAPLFGSSVLQQLPPPHGGVRTGPPGGSHTTCGRGMGLGARGCSRPKQPTAPLPLCLVQPLRGGFVGSHSLWGMDLVWGVQGVRAGRRGGAGCGGSSASGAGLGGGFGVGVGGFSQIHGVSAPSRPVGAGVLLHGVSGAGQAGGSQQGDRLSPPGGQAASPPPVSPLLPCLAPSHVSPASPRWR